jgi:DNA-binding MarR family transcriptional regulator
MKKHSLRDDIGYWLNRLRMEVHSSFESKIEALGVTIPQWCVLVSLYNKDAENVSELAAFIDTDKGFVSRVVEQLVQMELAERHEGKDRRSQLVLLTAKAKALTRKLIVCAEKNEAEFFDVLSANEKDALQHIFEKLLLNAGIDYLRKK